MCPLLSGNGGLNRKVRGNGATAEVCKDREGGWKARHPLEVKNFASLMPMCRYHAARDLQQPAVVGAIGSDATIPCQICGCVRRRRGGGKPDLGH